MSLGAGQSIVADRRALEPSNAGYRGGPQMPTPHSTETTPPPAVPVAATERPQLLFFYSATSGSSRRVEGYLAQVLQRRRNHETFAIRRIDADDHQALADRFRVQELPTLIVVTEQRVRARMSRPRGCAEITELLSPWLS